MLAIAKIVFGVTRRRASTSANPLTPVHVDPSSKMIAADTPGMPCV
jgi:hypothetical protein